MVLPKLFARAILVVFIAVLAAAFFADGRPEVSDDSSGFQTAKALKHLEQITSEPHPVGSQRQIEVGDYLMRELQALGLDVSFQEATGMNVVFGVSIYGRARNVVAVLEGDTHEQAVLLSAHYDSVPGSPGAGDNGAAVVALLETARIMSLEPKPKRDVIFLFTDSEEHGLLGSNLFASEHPLAGNVGYFFNFEGRGNTGPTLLFETTPGNGAMVAEFLKAVPHAMGTSLAPAVYKVMPNQSDFTSIKKIEGAQGLNFAFLEGVNHYHNSFDSFPQFDPRTLAHHGEIALSLARHFANLDVPPAVSQDVIFFDLPGGLMISYGGTFALILSVLILGGWIFLWFRARKVGEAPISGISAAFFLQLASVLSAAVITILGLKVLWALHSQYQLHPLHTYNSQLYFGLFAMLAVLVAGLLASFSTRRFGWQATLIGSAFFYLPMLLASTIAMPGISYLFCWPLLAGLIVTWFCGSKEEAGPALAFGLALSALPVLLIVIPTAHSLFIALPMKLGFVSVLFVALGAGMAMPVFAALHHRQPLTPIVFLLIAGFFLFRAESTSGYSSEHPEAGGVAYVQNCDSDEAWLMSADNYEGSIAKIFFDGKREPVPNSLDVGFLKGRYWSRPIASQSMVGPSIEVLDDSNEGGVRTLRLSIDSPESAPYLGIFCRAEGLESATLDNRPLHLYPNLAIVFTANMGSDPMTLTLKLPMGKSAKLTVFERRYQMPPIEGLPVGIPEGTVSGFPGMMPFYGSHLFRKLDL